MKITSIVGRVVKPKYYCGLDLGLQTIKGALVRVVDDQNLELLSVTEVSSTGLRDGAVSDLGELAQSIAQIVNALNQKTMVKIDRIYLGIGGEGLSQRLSSAVMPLVDSGTRVIIQADVNKIIHQARLLGIGLEEESVHDVPQFFRVDQTNTALNPVGLMGRKLEAQLLLLVANASRLRNLAKAVHQSGFEVGGIFFSALSAAEAVLDKTERAGGVALMDIGSNMTNILIFKDSRLVDVQLIPWGGQYVTQTLAERLGLTVSLAEDIKRSHAVAQPTVVVAGEILVKREKGYMPVSRESVCEAVNWEIENLLTHIETVIKGSPYYHQLSSGIVMIGGGALLPGLMERIESRTNLTVRMGVATKGLNNAALFASAIGLAQSGYWRTKEKQVMAQANKVKLSLWQRLREMAQEYF